jgi:hypothetical protein
MAKDYKNNDLAGSDGPDDPNELDLGKLKGQEINSG